MPKHNQALDKAWGFRGNEYCLNCESLKKCQEQTKRYGISLDPDNWFCVGHAKG